MNSLRDFFVSRRLTLGVLVLAALVLVACDGGPGESWPGVTANADTSVIYVANNKSVVALDALSGEKLWAEDYTYEEALFFAVPVGDNGTVFVGDYEGRMHAIDATTGEQQWVYEPERRMIAGPISPDPKDRVIGSVAVSEDAVFFGLGSRNVTAVSRETHEELWTFETDHGVWGEPLYFDKTETAPATLYVVSLDHYLYAIHAESGDQLWKLDLGGAAPGGMTYDEERNWVYVGTFVSEIVAVDLDAHTIVDRVKVSDWVWGRPALQDDILYVGDLGGNLYAIPIVDNRFGEFADIDIADGGIRSTPVLTDGMVIVSSQDKHIYVVNKELDTVEWSEKTKGEALTEMVFVPSGEEGQAGLIVVGTSDNDQKVVAFDYDSREEVWRYD